MITLKSLKGPNKTYWLLKNSLIPKKSAIKCVIFKNRLNRLRSNFIEICKNNDKLVS